MPRPNNIRAMAMKIALQVQKAAAKGAGACAIFLTSRLKEVVSVPAPRKRVVNSVGEIYYRAKTRAVSGAPPRKLSGKLRQSITYKINYVPGSKKAVSAVVGVKARSNLGYNYPAHLERTNHKFFKPTIARYRTQLTTIMGRAIRGL